MHFSYMRSIILLLSSNESINIVLRGNHSLSLFTSHYSTQSQNIKSRVNHSAGDTFHFSFFSQEVDKLWIELWIGWYGVKYDMTNTTKFEPVQ